MSTNHTSATVVLVEAPAEELDPLPGVVRLEQDVIEALKAHYGPYYCDAKPITACMWGPGPIPYYMQPVYNCILGMPNGEHKYNNERSIHIAKNWLYNLPNYLMEAKSDYHNELCVVLAHCDVSFTRYLSYRNPTKSKDGDNYTFTFNTKDMGREFLNDEEKHEYLARRHVMVLSTKWDVGKGKGYLIKRTKMYINGKIYRESDHTPFSPKYIDKQFHQSDKKIELYHLLDYKEDIKEIKYEVEGVMDSMSNFFQLELLEERIRPFYHILKEAAEKYFRDEITLEQCMLDLRDSYLALPKYGE